MVDSQRGVNERLRGGSGDVSIMSAHQFFAVDPMSLLYTRKIEVENLMRGVH